MFSGYGNSQYQSSYPQEMTSSTSSGLYPTFPTTGTTSNYTVSDYISLVPFSNH